MQELEECFICTESDPVPRKSACLCTDRYVHDACLAKMLENAKQTACPVCAAPYTNVTSRVVVVGVSLWNRGGAVLMAAVLGSIMITCASNTWWVYARSNLSTRTDGDGDASAGVPRAGLSKNASKMAMRWRGSIRETHAEGQVELLVGVR